MFATLTELKQYMSITTPQDEQKLTNLLDMANSFVSDYTNIKEITQGTIEVQDYLPLPNNRMIIDEEGISSITEVYVDGALTDITANIMRGYMVVLSKEVSGSIKLVCTIQASQEIPGLQALKVAVMELVKFYLKQEYKSQISQGGESINFDKVSYIPQHVKSILDLYRR